MNCNNAAAAYICFLAILTAHPDPTLDSYMNQWSIFGGEGN